METRENTKQKLEIAHILASCSNELDLCPVQFKAVQDILKCRTAKAGGHIKFCDSCPHFEQSYNSCRNRNCPKCQFIKQQQWGDKLKGRLVPGKYHHVVFTIPQELNNLFYINQSNCYGLLFQSAKQALLQAGKNPQFLGADIGAVAVLHTWGQTLTYHPHIHMLVPAGGLSEDGTEWIPTRNKFFVPVKALSAMFRGIMVKALAKIISKGLLKIPNGFEGFDALKNKLFAKSWNVYSKKTFNGANGVLDYLGKYTNRVAISNSRLLSMKDNKVTFFYRDNRDKSKGKLMTLDITEFARRFLMHVLPSGFYKIRYIGFLAVVHLHSKREQAISLIGKVMWLSRLEGLCTYEVLRSIMGKDPALCPVCKNGHMVRGRDFNPIE